MEPLARASNSRVRDGARCRNGFSGGGIGTHPHEHGAENYLVVPEVLQPIEGLSYHNSDAPQDDNGRTDLKQIQVDPLGAVTREKQNLPNIGLVTVPALEVKHSEGDCTRMSSGVVVRWGRVRRNHRLGMGSLAFVGTKQGQNRGPFGTIENLPTHRETFTVARTFSGLTAAG